MNTGVKHMAKSKATATKIDGLKVPERFLPSKSEYKQIDRFFKQHGHFERLGPAS